MARIILLSLVALIITFATSFAAGTFQYQTIIVNGITTPRYVMTANMPLTSKLSLALYAQTDNAWSEAYVGPAYAPTSWSQIGIQFGTEAYTTVTRQAAFVWVGSKSMSALAIVEGGGSARFTAVDLEYTHQSMSTGYVHDTLLGHGAKVAVMLKSYAVWVSTQTHGSKLAVQRNF